MASLYQAFVEVVPETRGLQRRLNKEFSAAGPGAGAAAGKGINEGVLGSVGKLAGPLAAAFAALGIGKLVSDSISNASDLAEAGTAITAVFGEADKTIQAFASGSASTLGQSTNQTLDAARVFGVFGKAAGLGGEDLADFSTEFITLAADLASFNNTTPEEAIEALGSGLRGEAEPLRKYGVLLDDAALKARAATLGIYSGTGALTAQQKVLASQAEILAQTGVAQGDFAKTSGGLANQQRILSAGLENLSTSFGAILLPAMTTVVGYLNRTVVPAFQGVVPQVKAIIDLLSGGDFSGSFAAAFGVAEDSPLVDFLFDVREGFIAFGTYLGTTFAPVFSTLGPVFAGLLPKIVDLVAEFSPLGMLLETLEPVLPAVAAAMGALITALSSSDVGAPIATMFAALAAVLPSLVDAFLELLPAATDLFVSLLPILADVLVKLLPPLAALATEVLPIAVDLIVALSDALVFLAPIISWVADVLAGFIGFAGTPTQKILHDFADFLLGFGPVGEFFSGIIRGLGDLLRDGLAGAFGIVITKIGEALAAMVGLGANAVSAVGDLSGTLFSAGSALLGGFVAGIKSMLGPVGDAISGILDFAADHFPHSPAKRGPFSGSGWTAIKSAGLAIGDQFGAGLAASEPAFNAELASLVPTSSLTAKVDASVYGSSAGGGVGSAEGLRPIVQNISTLHGQSNAEIAHIASNDLNGTMRGF